MTTPKPRLACRTLVPGLLLVAISMAHSEPPNRFDCYTNSTYYKRWHWAFDQRAFPLGYIPSEAYGEALKVNQAHEPRPKSLTPGSGDLWVNIGPSPVLGGQIGVQDGTRPMSGRITALAADPTDTNHWLAGAAEGGVWETRDAGTHWTPKTDAQASLAMGALAFAPNNSAVIYAGTGGGYFSSDSHAGAGLLKSSDGGVTWQLLATNTFASISFTRLRVNQTNAAFVMAAAARGFFGRDGEYPPVLPTRGIFSSSNGGTSWSLRLAGEATGLEVDPGNFRHQYAGLGEIFGSTANGVYRSTDGGNTWSPLTGPWTGAFGGIGRVEIALAPSNPNVVYVSIQDALDGTGNDGGLLGLWQTTNAWDTSPNWINIPVAATDDGSGVLGYCGWDPAYSQAVNACWVTHILTVDPANPNILYAGGVPLWKFDGTTWTEVSMIVSDPQHGIKVDQHALAWAGNRLLVGNDGGVWSTTDGGSTWNDHNSTLVTLQFYEAALHPTRPNFAIAGSQDQGTTVWTGSNAWPLLFGGDGASTAVSSTAPDQNWALSAQDLAIFRTLDGGQTIESADSGIDTTGVPFIARLKKSPVDDDIFIAGTDKLWKCTDFFSASSPSWLVNGPTMNSGLSALAFAASDLSSSTYAFGTANGQMRLTSNGGANWSDLDPANAIPNRYVTDLAFNPTNANVLYVSLSGFDQGTPSQPGHLFRTTNALAASPNWVNISPPANLPYNCLALDPANPGLLFVGTDLGVWRSTNNGAAWVHMGPASGMPNVSVYDLKLATTGRCIAFTHGRGALALVDSALQGPPVITSFVPGTGSAQLDFTSELNHLYRVEQADQLPASAWNTVADQIQGTGSIIQTNAMQGPAAQGFYRIRQLQ